VFQHRSACIYGGGDRRDQLNRLSQNPAFLVACPGRLINHIEGNCVSLGRVSFLVLDESDRMLDMGFENQIRLIIAAIPSNRQTVMFSATWPKAVR
jgi:superfamily II DNA/RNA helicase